MARRSGDMDIEFNQDTLDDIMRAPAVVEQTRAVAESGARIARSTAPEDTGAYKGGLAVERRESRYRTVWRVVGRDPKTMLIESQRGVLARALKALGRRRG